MKLLEDTENYLLNKVRLPVVREEFFYPTEASVITKFEGVIGHCIRSSYYRYQGVVPSKPSSKYMQWIFLTGKSLETGLVDKWKEMGIWVDNNIKFRSKEHHISGELDCVIRDPETQELILCEVKTYYGYEATKEIKGNPKKGIPGQPKIQNLLQILIYLYLHQHIFKYGKLIYLDKVCKDNAEFDIQLVKEKDKTYPAINGTVKRAYCIEDVLARYKQLHQYVENDILPARDYELIYSDEKVEKLFADGEISKTKYEKWKKKGVPIGDWQCAYCPYTNECWDLGTQIFTEDTEDDIK